MLQVVTSPMIVILTTLDVSYMLLENIHSTDVTQYCHIFIVQVPISPIFYEQLFRTKVFCAAFTCLQFGFVIFWRKIFGAKAAHKMLVKLTLLLVFKMFDETACRRRS